jgi:hypothetical protein
MKILNGQSDKSVNEITLLLTQKEALELKDALEELLQNALGNHAHISDYDNDKELTVSIYGTSTLDKSFSERIRRLINTDT